MAAPLIGAPGGILANVVWDGRRSEQFPLNPEDGGHRTEDVAAA
jgi:hypothetical protein